MHQLKQSVHLWPQLALLPVTYPTPVQCPGQVIACPQRKDGHRRRWIEAQLVQNGEYPAHL